MSVKRRQHSSNFKSKVAIAAIRQDRTISELCSEYGVRPSVIYKWKKVLQEGAGSLFEGGQEVVQVHSKEELEKLYAQIGRLKVENDFLKKKLGE